MTEDERAHWEGEILLRSSGELARERLELLEEAIADDEELAAFAEFVEGELGGASNAPRDFAGEAIAGAAGDGAEKVAMFPVGASWWMGAAAVVVGGLALFFLRPGGDGGSEVVEAAVPGERITMQFSERGLGLEEEVVRAREDFRRGRYARRTVL
ncbi:MAG: hypothetical protein AAF591_05975 [Verrucomicrobiota bacterium]